MLTMVKDRFLNRGKVTATLWMESNDEVLNLFVDPTALAGVLKSLSKKHDPTGADLKAFLATQLGTILFTTSGLRMHYKDFEQAVETRLDNLEHHDYDNDEVDVFCSLIRVGCSRLVEMGLGRFDGVWARMFYVVEEITVAKCSTNEQWSKRLAARTVAIGLQNGQLSLLP